MNTLLSHFFLHLLESTCWVLSLLLLLQLLNFRQSSVRCWIYRLSFVKFLLPTFLLGAMFQHQEIGELAPYIVYASGTVHQLNDQMVYQTPTFSVAVVGGIIALLLILVGALVTGLQHRKIIRGMRSFDGQHRSQLEQALKAQHCNADQLSGYTIEAGPSIGLYGIFRPRIIAKREFLECLDAAELHSALQHEILHWKNRDHWWRLLVETMVSVFWFHPLVWYLRKQLTLETEKRCDEEVIGSGTTNRTYANCLLKAANFNEGLRMYGGAIALSESALKQRVSNVIQYQYRKVNRMKIVTMAALAGVALTGSFMVFGTVSDPVPSEQKLYDISEVDERPIAQFQLEPVYPKELKELGISGKVVLSFVVDQNGVVEDVVVEKSTDFFFEQPSIDAVLKWKFFPGMIAGKTVKTHVRSPLVYQAKAEEKVSDFSKLRNSDDPEDHEFMKRWEPRWKAVQDLRKNEWNSREEAEAWREMATVVYAELKAYLSKYEDTSEKRF